MRTIVCRIVLIAGVVAFLAAGGCAPAPSPTPSPAPAPPQGGPGSAVPRPHLETQADGAALAYGWVIRMDLEGGFWALTDADPSMHGIGTTVVVLLPGKTAEKDIAALADRYVRATGKAVEGVSIRMAGPEMTVDAIEELAPNGASAPPPPG